MNVRQQSYKKYRLEGFSAYAAARKAGYSHAYAKNATERLEKGGTFQQILEIAGLTDKKIAELVSTGMQAQKENGEPDWNIRHKYLETALKLNKLIDAGPSVEQHTHFNYVWNNDQNSVRSPAVPDRNP